jgi:hypothetical protein
MEGIIYDTTSARGSFVFTLRHLPTPSPLADYSAVAVTSSPSGGTRGGSSVRPSPAPWAGGWRLRPLPRWRSFPLFYIYAAAFTAKDEWKGFYESPFPLPGYADAVKMGRALRHVKRSIGSPLPADYDHDGRLDLAYWEPTAREIRVSLTRGRSVDRTIPVPPDAVPIFVRMY